MPVYKMQNILRSLPNRYSAL